MSRFGRINITVCWQDTVVNRRRLRVGHWSMQTTVNIGWLHRWTRMSTDTLTTCFPLFWRQSFTIGNHVVILANFNIHAMWWRWITTFGNVQMIFIWCRSSARQNVSVFAQFNGYFSLVYKLINNLLFHLDATRPRINDIICFDLDMTRRRLGAVDTVCIGRNSRTSDIIFVEANMTRPRFCSNWFFNAVVLDVVCQVFTLGVD